ncbi:MAG: ERAP1-like C-terminal domain-containing protein [Deltaproteobacteria bacterium]
MSRSVQRASSALPASLSATTRWALLDDARTLFWGGGLPVDELLALYDGFRAERDPHVVELIISVLARLDGSFVPPEDRPALRAWIAGYLHPIAHDLGTRRGSTDDDDRVLLRGAVLSSLGAHGEDPAMYAMAERAARRFVRDPHSVDPEEAAWALPLSSRHASATRLQALLATLSRTNDPAARELIAASIGSFERPEIARDALRTAVTGGSVNADEFSTVLGAAVAPAATRAVAVAWLREHIDEITARLDALSLAYLPKLTVQGACTRDEIDAEHAFWGPRIARVEGGERMFAAGLEVAERCVALRAREGARLHAYLTTRREAHRE